MMAKGGDSQRSNGSRFTKPYNVSNSFVTKVASKVSDYLGGWFHSSMRPSNNASSSEATSSSAASGDTANRRMFENYEIKRPSVLPHSFLDVEDVDSVSSPAKRFKLSQADKVDVDFSVSPIPSTSGLFTNRSFDLPKDEDCRTSEPGPSRNLKNQRYSRTSVAAPPTSSTSTDVKANGTADNHSDSSESTSGCSSLVPQSDRLSQSAYGCTSRKKNLEEKMKYARQLQQSRASVFLNRSIPVTDTPGKRKKPSFDVTAYGSSSMDKSLLREKLTNSPFYTGQTSYGGASAYTLNRNSYYSQRGSRRFLDKREGMQMEVKPSHDGSTECLTNMSHTAKKILEALEQFSTPVSDAKRIPVNRLTPLGSKRRRFVEDSSEARMRLSTPISPLNPNAGPVISGLNVPTVPDLLKLKRLERIQDSTAAARETAVEKDGYALPAEVAAAKRTGKIVTKLKDREKTVRMDMLEEVALPNIPLPITTLPKFDFKLPETTAKSTPNKTETSRREGNFKFSEPIYVSTDSIADDSGRKNGFTFSEPVNVLENKKEAKKETTGKLANFMSNDAVAKLKRKSINDYSSRKTSEVSVPPVSAELKTGSVLDFLKKSAAKENVVDEKKSPVKPVSGTWECGNCLIRNLNDFKICCGCKVARVNQEEKERTLSRPHKEKSSSDEMKQPPPPPLPAASGFGDKFKPPADSWTCKECFVNNKKTALKCVACESVNPSAVPPKEMATPEIPKPIPGTSGFGDFFKKQANQWECSVCMILNKEEVAKCVACETPKPGSKVEKSEPKFDLGATPSPGGFLFGIDKANGVKSAADSSTFKFQANGPQSVESPAKGNSQSQLKSVTTSVGVFTFGIPPAVAQDRKEESPKAEVKAASPEATTSNRFMVTSTSGPRKDEASSEPAVGRADEEGKGAKAEAKNDKNEVSVTDSSKTGSENFKPFIFGSSNKSSTNAFFGIASKVENEKTGEPQNNTSNLFFGAGSNSLETVSSSTTDIINLKQNKSTSETSPPDSGLPKLPKTFQFSPFGATETMTQNTVANVAQQDANEAEVKTSAAASTSFATAASASVFGSTSLLDNSSSKMTFGTSSILSTPSGFATGNLTSSNPVSPFTMPVQPFGSSGFASLAQGPGSAPAPAPGSSLPSVPSQAPGTAPATVPALAPASAPEHNFGIASEPTAKPALGGANAFGGSPATFGGVPNPFASTAASSSPNPEPAKSFMSSSAVPNFGSTPFGSFHAAAAADKSSRPFIFGSTTRSTTPATTAPGVFTFGASTPSQPSQFSFGQQSGAPNFSFGSASAANVFSGFGQAKSSSEGSPANLSFGTPVFGQSSAPAAFQSSAPTFEFGSSTSQQQQKAPELFQFGATPSQSQPSSAPGGTVFSLSVPSKFNFTSEQTGAGVSSEAPKNLPRKVIKAVRRTNPRRAN